MRLREILQAKGKHVHTCTPDATLDDVVRELVKHNVGSLVVCRREEADEEHPIVLGIITERDILRANAAHRAPLEQIRVQSTMSSNLATALPDDPIELAMEIMTDRRVRHLPIVVDGRLHGMISIGDIVKANHDELERENGYMRSYISGGSAAVTVSSVSVVTGTSQ